GGLTRRAKRRLDAPVGVYSRETISTLGMGAEWEDLTVDAEGTDAEPPAFTDGGKQCRRIVPRDPREILPPGHRLQSPDVPMGRGAKLDLGVEEETAQPPPDP